MEGTRVMDEERVDPVCACGHLHIVSVSEDGADAGCSMLGKGCDCWNWHEVKWYRDALGRPIAWRVVPKR